MRVFGIDFGTTYTLISYIDNGQISFLKFDNEEILLPTKVEDLENLKRVLILKAKELKQNDFYEKTVRFFELLSLYIEKKFPELTNELKNCVLSVPVRFNDVVRNFIKSAAISAKFNVLKLIHEPVAAAIFNLQNAKNGNYLIYDLGGGTFDLTLLKLEDKMFHVLSIDGLEKFGGIDIDCLIAKKLNISLNEAEILKKTEYLPFLDEFLQKTYVLSENLINSIELEAIVLVGGSSYLKNIENYFEKSYKVIKKGNLQTAVAAGACLFGNDFLNENQFLIDVTPFNLGIEGFGNKMEVIIGQNSPIPMIKTEKFIPVNEKILIKILQGNHELASECDLLAEFEVNSSNMFDITFILDYDGILSIKLLNETWIISDIFKKNLFL